MLLANKYLKQSQTIRVLAYILENILEVRRIFSQSSILIRNNRVKRFDFMHFLVKESTRFLISYFQIYRYQFDHTCYWHFKYTIDHTWPESYFCSNIYQYCQLLHKKTF